METAGSSDALVLFTRLHGVTSQEVIFLIFTAVRGNDCETSNHTIAVARYWLRNRHERNNYTAKRGYNNNEKRYFLRGKYQVL
jgi:hypothetical protein